MARGKSREKHRQPKTKLGRKLQAVRRGARHSRRLRAIDRIVALVATLLIVAVGLLCLVIPQTIVHVLPYLLGAVMVFAGVAGIVAAVRDGVFAETGELGADALVGAAAGGGAVAESCASAESSAPRRREHLIEEESRGVGASFVLVILGAFSMACGGRSIGFLGVAWGLITLYKLGSEVDEIVHLVRAKRPVAVPSAVVAVLELALALLLILAPFENIEHHVIVLGIELVLNPFKLHWERGRRGAAIDA